MTHFSLRIVDLDENNVNDALNVCTPSNMRNDRNIKIGYAIRKEWLMSLYRRIGSCAKVAYLEKDPVGMIQFTPLHVIPYFKINRKDALYIHCIYVQEKHRRRGIGSALLDGLINDMSKPNKLFPQTPCNIIVTSARKLYGFTQVGLFKHKGFKRIKGNPDVGLVLPLFTSADMNVGIPLSRPKVLKERGVKIFFKPTCQYCKYTNEHVIKAEIRKANKIIPIEEFNLWTYSEEAIRRRITCVATYTNGKPLLPMSPRKFKEALRHLSSKTNS